MESMEGLTKEHVEVSIEGQKYTIRSNLNSLQVRQLATYVDQMMSEIRKRTPTMAPSRVAILAALNIAEELFRIRENCADVSQRTSQLIGLIDEKCSPKAS